MPKLMRAIRVSEFGAPLVLKLRSDVTVPQPGHRQEATGGRGVDVIVEMLANANLSKDLQMLAKGGRVVIIGSRGSIEINPADIMVKESSVTGVLVFNATPEENKECAALLFAGMEAGWLRPVVGSKYPLEKAAQAHHDIIESPGAAGKIVLTMK